MGKSLFCFLFSLALLATTAQAEESAWVPPKANLPTMLVTWGNQGVSSESYLHVLHRSVLARPATYHIPDGFVQDAMLGLEQRLRHIPEPTAEEIQALYQHEIKLAGGQDQFDARLLQAKVTPQEVEIAIRKGLLLKAIVRYHRRLPPNAKISDKLAAAVLDGLRDLHKPTFHGLGPKRSDRVFTIAGRHYHAEEVLDWIIQTAPQKKLRGILEQLVEDKLILLAARDQKLTIEKKTMNQILLILLQDDLSKKALLQYAEDNRKSLTAVRLRALFFDNHPNTQKGEALARAKKTLGLLQAKNLHFDEAASHFSDTARHAKGGELGYVVKSQEMVNTIPPRAYGLDFLANKQSPLTILPDPVLAQTLAQLKDGEMSSVVPNREGCIILHRIESRTITHTELALPYLQAHLLQQKRVALLKRLRAAHRFIYFWTPVRGMLSAPDDTTGWVESRE